MCHLGMAKELNSIVVAEGQEVFVGKVVLKDKVKD